MVGGGGHEVYGNSVFFVQFFCEPKTAGSISLLFKKINHCIKINSYHCMQYSG